MSGGALFVPLRDRVLVRPTPEKDVTAGGIIIPDANKDRPRRGVVVAAGPGFWQNGVFVPCALRAGDRVVYGKFSGQEHAVDGEKLLVMREDEVLGLELEGLAPETAWPEGLRTERENAGRPVLAKPTTLAVSELAGSSDAPLCESPVTIAGQVWACNRPKGHDGEHFRHTPDVEGAWQEDYERPAPPTPAERTDPDRS